MWRPISLMPASYPSSTCRKIVAVIPAVILAAGKSTRMGRPKATLPLGGATFLGTIVRSFQEAGVDDVVVVLGYEAASIEESLRQEGVTARLVVNEGYESGQLSSLLTGLRAVDRPGVRAILLSLVDVPLVSASTIRSVRRRSCRRRQAGRPRPHVGRGRRRSQRRGVISGYRHARRLRAVGASQRRSPRIAGLEASSTRAPRVKGLTSQN